MDFATPDIWIFESEEFNFEPIYTIKERAKYFLFILQEDFSIT